MTAQEMVAFETEVAARFEAGEIHGPVHLSSGNESQLIEVFDSIKDTDWVFSTWRSHYHALLHGIPRDWLMSEIVAGRSINIKSPEHRFFTSAIVGGILPIAVGVAAGIKRAGGEEWVWCFIGDMAMSIGTFWDADTHAMAHDLPITFIVEDNGLSVNTPTLTALGWVKGESGKNKKMRKYEYTPTLPHYGVTKGTTF